MRISQFNKLVHHRSYLASQFLRRHRTVIILGAFVFWTAMLAKMGYFRKLASFGGTGFFSRTQFSVFVTGLFLAYESFRLYQRHKLLDDYARTRGKIEQFE